MVLMKKIVLSILFVLVLCGSSNAEVDHIKDILTVDKNQLTKLNGEQIKEKVTDKNFFGFWIDVQNNYEWDEIYYKNGDHLYNDKNIADPTDTYSSKGKWKVENDKICYLYQGEKEFECASLYEKVEGGDTNYYWESSETGAIYAKTIRVIDLITIVETNTLKLKALNECGGCNLQGVDLLGADLGGAELWAANLRGANLRGANLSGANLLGAFLNADLREADLTEANLKIADLSGANLSGANLRGANLAAAKLRKADLREADLTEADLTEADLSGANLRGANLRGANLKNAILNRATLCNTITPWGTDDSRC